MRVRWTTTTLLLASIAASGCGKKPSGSTSVAKAASSAPAPSPWPAALAAKEGKGWFDVTTHGSGQTAPITGKQCAHWTLRYQAKVPDPGVTRSFDDTWPKDELILTVDGKEVAVPVQRIEWEVLPTATAGYSLKSADLPGKVREMLTSKVWMGKPSETLPETVGGMERCLAPATKYRAELRKKVSPGIGDSYDLALAPAE